MAFTLAGLLLVLNFTPLVAAEASSHTECIGDSDYVHRPTDFGAGCAKGTIVTYVECEGDTDNRSCEVWADYHRVRVTGTGTCGNASSPWGDLEAQTCVTATDLPETSAMNQTGEEHLKTYDDVPEDGKTVVIPALVCVWPDRSQNVEDSERCHRYPHEVPLPPDSRASGGIVDDVTTIVNSTADYVETTVKNAEPPVGVGP